jgi:diguanylate cyclase (GGDEF)-like protein
MSDSESPQPAPDRNGAPDASVGATAGSSPPLGSLVPALSATWRPGDENDTQAAKATPGRDRLRNVRQLAHARKGVWGAAALLCVAAGTLGSVLGAHAVARSDADKARLGFKQSSAEISSTLKLSVQREEGVASGASTFFAGNPKASQAEFDKWATWSRALHKSPEIQSLGFVALIPTVQPGSLQARVPGGPLTSRAARPAPGTVGEVRAAPVGAGAFHCVAVASVARGTVNSPQAGLDHCAKTRGLLSSRDSGLSIYTAGRSGTLSTVTPVYRGDATPFTLKGRRAAFVGWLREGLSPSAVVTGALRGHTQGAVSLHYRAGSTTVSITAGNQQPGAQSTTVALHNGWSARIFGAPLSGGVLANRTSLALLIAGIVLSALLGVLVFALGSSRRRAPATAAPQPREQLYDMLTGLPNHTLTLDLAERMVARAARQSGMLAGALFIDIDWFKDVNDKLGQAAGDQLLKIVAERLENVIRTGDTVGRLGGDQFVVLVESAARGVRLDSLARRAIEALHKPVALEDFGPSFFLTVSIGVAFGRYAASEELLRDAELALQAAKTAGKDRYTLFNANMRSVIEDRGMLEVDLNAALQEHQFFLLYQPIYDLSTRQVAGLEAMIRWRHPTRGVLLPDEFVPLAEDSGLIVPIGRWVLEEACNRAAAWNVTGHKIGISVMVSANQLHRDGFATDVRRALQQSGIEPSLLTLEIAESTVMLDVAATAARLQEVKLLGLRIAIDDFGTGYAYRSDLGQMPLDFLKVDRSSLAASDDEDYRSWLLEAILHFGHDLSLGVIAKGIETHEQLSAIEAMGCTMAQGYFLGQPTSVETVESLFDAQLAPAQTSPPTQ